MRKKSDKEEIIVDIDDSTEQENRDLRKDNTKKGSYKDNTKLIAALFLLVVLILMAVMHIHSGPIIVTGVVLGVLIYLLNKKNKN